MCGRFYIEEEPDDTIGRMIALLNREMPGVRTSGTFCPGDTVAMIVSDASGRPGLMPARWGFALPEKRLVFNARSESAGEKPLFRESLRMYRCVLPASGYYEWNADRLMHSVRRTDAGHICLAAIYRREPEGVACTVLTRPPTEPMSVLHDRMPVILHDSQVREWLRPDADPAKYIGDSVTSLRFDPVPGQTLQLKMTGL